MATSSQLFVFLAIFVIPSVLATDYMVGDDKGWTTQFNYSSWARGKTFFVGDYLIFKYEKGMHNVFRVNSTGFQQCAPPTDVKPFESGNDVLPLVFSGRKWFISGVGHHCETGQRLAITVLDPAAAPGPSSVPGASAAAPSGQSPHPGVTTPQSSPVPGEPTPKSSLPSATAPPPPPPSGAATKAAVSSHLGFLAFGVLAGIMILT